MAIEDFGTYTEVDPNSRIAKTTRRVTWADLQTRNESAYVYSDKGVDFFSANFVHRLAFEITEYPGGIFVSPWVLANVVDDVSAINAGDAIYILHAGSGGNPAIRIDERVAGTSYTSSLYVISLNTPYFLSIERDESVGTFGTLYCYVFSDAARATLLTTLSLALHQKTDFRYVYPIATFDDAPGVTNETSGYVENLELFGPTDLGVLPVVTAQPLTSIVTTTASGHGTIVDLGISTVSAHGYVWDKTIDPTTTDSSSGFWGSTDEGAGSLGIFESSITGLSEGQEYWARPYATNGAGTSYGANVYFIAGQPGTLRIKAEYAVVQEQWHYVGESGKEYQVTGIAV